MHESLIEKEIRTIVRDSIGFDENVTSGDSIRIATNQRMKAIGEISLGNYLAYVMSSASELDELIQLLLVSESYFEREPATLDALIQYLKNLRLTRGHEKLRMLCAPCARGEEAISMLHAAREAGFCVNNIEIVGIDFSIEAIRLAKAGIYTQHSFRETPRAFTERYFIRDGNYYVLRQEFRPPLTFRRENLLDLNFSEDRYDAIFCRNLLIYLGSSEQEILLGKLAYALKPEGLLALGVAEAPCILKNSPLCKSPETHAVFIKNPESAPAVKAKRAKSSSIQLYEESKNGVSQIVSEDRIIEEEEHVPAHSPIASSDVEALLGVAFSAADKGNLVEARENCFLIIENNPFVPDSYYLLGLLSRAQGDEVMSVAYFRRTLYLDPCHEEALTQLRIRNSSRGKRV